MGTLRWESGARIRIKDGGKIWASYHRSRIAKGILDETYSQTEFSNDNEISHKTITLLMGGGRRNVLLDME